MPDAPELDTDLTLLMQACSAALGERVLAAVRRAAGHDVRFSDGYVFQHLVPGPQPITALARALGVTQQAISKQVADLEARGLVTREPHPDDGRIRLVALSPKGRRAVEAARRSRAELQREITDVLGSRRATALLDALRDVSAHTGATEHMAQRRLRPEAQR